MEDTPGLRDCEQRRVAGDGDREGLEAATSWSTRCGNR